jgi:Fe-S cluster assembly protein SufD
VPPLTTDLQASLGGPAWLVSRREEATRRLQQLGLPSPAEEVWRYSPIADLDLAGLVPATGFSVDLALPDALATVDLAAGRPGSLPVLPTGITISLLSEHPDGETLLGSVADDECDPIVALNASQLPDGLVIDVARGVRIAEPLVLRHGAIGGASFPRTIVRLAEGAEAGVVELFAGGDAATLNVPVAELLVADGAVLRYGAIQLLDLAAWHLATVKARVGRDGSVLQLTAGLGAAYDRMRTDTELAGQGASSQLRSTYLGSGSQVHDLRTHQRHLAPRTVSDLLCKGSVDDSSRSIYTGVIEVVHGAVRSDAQQTNHNLVLSPEARADTVPNLDIAENDVRCSHASTVGPLDEDQRYYLESRGIEPELVDELLIRGFFRDLLDRAPIAQAAALAGAAIEERLR